MTRSALIFRMLISFLSVSTGLAHGVKHALFEGGVGIEVTYDDGTPMRYCEVKLFSPVDSETEFQQAFTDKNGRFTFFPDSTGTWHVAVDDGMGHAASREIEIREGMKTGAKAPRSFARLQGIVTGVSLIFGIFGLGALFLGKKRRR